MPSLKQAFIAVTATALLAPAAALASHPAGDGPGPRGVDLPSIETRAPGTITTDNGLRVAGRLAPSTSGGEVLKFDTGQTVRIVCQVRGASVTGKFGTSTLWDLVAIGNGRGAYVTDTYVATGSDGRVAPPCGKGSLPTTQEPEQPAAPGGKPAAAKVLRWARSHVSWWAGKYSMTYRLPVDVSVKGMQTTQPPRGGNQGCDCSSFARWAMAQGGVDIGTYTGNIWTANGRMPFDHSSATTPNGRVSRGLGTPPGGWKAGDLVFYGVTDLDAGVGHVAIYSVDGRIVQCSGSRGSNAGSPIESNGTPTGWVRYKRVSG